jgi:exonuclease SbcC
VRPLDLEIQGFGPYATRQHIPFASLDQIFLIGGDTGAGKTTLFDAISYALYGKPLGTRESDQLRSKLAADDTSTYVRFRFSCAGKTWEVLRSPHWVRPAKRGSGHVVETVLTLAEIGADGARRELALKPAEIDRRLKDDIVHLQHDQFSKILVLPQGEFQRFLEMQSDDRAAILEKLFPTLEHRALTRAARDAVADVRKAVEDKAAALREVRRDFDPARFVEEDAALVATVAAARAVEVERDAAAAARRAELDAGRTLTAQIAAWTRAGADRAALEARRDEIDAARAALAASRRAVRVFPAMRAEADLRAQVVASEATLAGHRQRGVTLTARRDTLRPTVDGLDERDARLRDEDTALERLGARIGDLTALSRADAEIARLDTLVRAAVAAVEPTDAALRRAVAAVDALAAVSAQRDALTSNLRAALDRATTVAALAHDATRVHEWAEKHVPELARKRAEAVRAGDDARIGEATARSHLAAARARLEEQAVSVLAATLRDGERCPVCGSATHPDPARGQAHDEDVRARAASAERALTLAQAAVGKEATLAQGIEQEATLRREAADEARARLVAAGFADPDAWRDAKLAADRTAAALQGEDKAHAAALATRPAREAAVASARKAREDAALAVAAAEKAVAGARGARSGIVDRVGTVPDVAAALAAARDDHDARTRAAAAERTRIATIRAEWSRLVAELAAAESAIGTTGAALAGLQDQLGAAGSALAAALVEHGFPSVDEARATQRDAPTEARLQQGIDTWTRRATELDTQLRDLAAQIAERPAPDVVALQVAADAAGAETRTATEARTAAERAVDDLRRRRARHDELAAELERLTRDTAGLLQLAKDLDGENARRLDFPTYILTWWLSRVLVRASTRLRVLSEGRYTFALRPDTQDKRRRAGLDLDVFDAHAADRRDVRTLSGGEKFLASLSLALGLADVIQEHSGGVELDTLFIDEGFGSLDPSTMDRALQIIDEIGAHRRVGVISHVESVKRAIPCHVLVEKSPAGSRVRIG